MQPELSPAAGIAAALGLQAEAVCRRYLPHGRKQGRYWIAGDIDGARGRSLFVRLRGPGVPGKWTDAATGQHGDLLDLIRHRSRAPSLRAALDEARAFLALPVSPAPGSGNSFDATEAARRLWRQCRTIAGTHAEAYLHARAALPLRGTVPLRDAPALPVGLPGLPMASFAMPRAPAIGNGPTKRRRWWCASCAPVVGRRWSPPSPRKCRGRFRRRPRRGGSAPGSIRFAAGDRAAKAGVVVATPRKGALGRTILDPFSGGRGVSPQAPGPDQGSVRPGARRRPSLRSRDRRRGVVRGHREGRLPVLSDFMIVFCHGDEPHGRPGVRRTASGS